MTPAARVQAVIEILPRVMAGEAAAERAFADYFRTRRYAGSKDRAAIGGMLYDILRCQARLRWRIGADVDARRLAIAFLAEADAAAVPALFSGERFAPEPLSEEESALLEPVAPAPAPDWVEGNFPDWLGPRLAEAFGDDMAAELAALNQRAPADFRVNTLRTSRERVLEMLAGDSIAASAGALAPTAVRLDERADITRHKVFREGLVEPQDEGSQLIALLVAAEPGQQVVDYCAGGGGKALALAAAMRGKGQIYALDSDARRLERLKPRADRARAHNIQSRVIADGDPWLAELEGRIDRVLADVPCSGTGAWRRQPAARWRLSPEELAGLLEEQRKILDQAAVLVRPGGRLIYATCSVLPEENERQADAFLARQPDFTEIPCGEILPGLGQRLSLSPLRNCTDGFFAAVFERRQADDAAAPAAEE